MQYPAVHTSSNEKVKAVIGLDIGGNDIKSGALDLESSRVSPLAKDGLIKTPSMVQLEPKTTIRQLEKAITRTEELSGKNFDITALGIGVAGMITKQGVVTKSPNFGRSWDNYPLKDEASKYFGLPTYVGNDANVAGYAEAIRLSESYPELLSMPGVLFTVGTGLGGAIILEGGDILVGAFGKAAELGHISIRDPETSFDLSKENISCNCRRSGFGCAEQYTNLSFIEREVVKLLQEKPDHELSCYDDTYQAAKQVLRLAGKGDPECISILYSQARNLGRTAFELIQSVDPGWFIIGGGITEATPDIQHGYLMNIKSQIGDPNIKVMCAQLGDNAGWEGAAMLALHYVKSKQS